MHCGIVENVYGGTASNVQCLVGNSVTAGHGSTPMISNGGLPYTGLNLLAFALLGLALIVAGALFLRRAQ